MKNNQKNTSQERRQSTIKFILMFSMMIFMIGIVSSASNLGTFKQGDCIQLLQTCANCSYNNISKVVVTSGSTSGVALSTLTNMTKSDTYYSFGFCNTTSIGAYTVNGYGDTDGIKTTWTYNFEITPTGDLLQAGSANLYIVLIILSFCLFLLSLWGAMKIPYYNVRNDENEVVNVTWMKYLKIFCIVMCYVILMMLFALARGVAYNYLTGMNVYKLFNWMYVIMISILWPLIICSVVFAFIIALKDFDYKKAIVKGLNKE